ncbi:hypothetical protein EMIHUDRAFT_448004 [Emiliania huxleyi CCMP1516]|uniref:Ubiquitin-like domain-containing protein n=2 Tax=Emiliania huxleyi TaxID=2903 RepID=A0A0D3J444_EMIH1|nr:hypothetical protein EMIHUDRAFT_448004 [Emiliania huxleyi CCMP1516]EOD18279.1 hypothetical protein EMIHUDRAFT_448004 [Emiliania huxleyi CCMP1516]|eukprot:XP_005770708.1 hypothetical protein EMIHUDRAFT_448004 [Emiliania huxleyi CCMP1516]
MDGGEVLVAQAETGCGHTLEVAAADSVIGLKTVLSEVTGLDVGCQILLLEGERLENDASLGEYGLPASSGARSRPVFLFNRRSLNRSAPLPDPPGLAPAEALVPEGLPEELLSERYAQFQASYEETTALQQQLVASFDADLAALRGAPLDDAIAELEGWGAGVSLLHCCGEERLRSWLSECQHNADHLTAKAAQFALQWSELWRELQAGIALEEEAPETHAPPSSAELRLRTTSTLLQQGDSVLTELSRDALRVSRLVDEQTQECAALETLHERHLQVLLPQMRSLDASLRGAQEEAGATRGAMHTKVFQRLRAISALQSQIAELRNKLHLYTSLLARVRVYCDQLLLMRGTDLRRLPITYEACLREALAAARESEVARRDAFMSEHGSLLPRNLRAFSALLHARPAYIEVNSREGHAGVRERGSAAAAPSGVRAGSSEALAGSEAVVVEAPAADAGHAHPPPSTSAIADAAPSPDASLERSPPAVCPEPAAGSIAVASVAAAAVASARALAAQQLALADDGAEGASPEARASGSGGEEGAAAEAAPEGIARSTSDEGASRARDEGRLPIQRSLSAQSALNRAGRRRRARADGQGAFPALASTPLAALDLSGRFYNRDVSGERDVAYAAAALDALGTPMEGLPIAAASQLQRRVTAQESVAASLRRREQLSDGGTPVTLALTVSGGGVAEDPPTAQLACRRVLSSELEELEASHEAVWQAHCTLSSAVRLYAAAKGAAERLVSSARQAAHANARLGHVMATEREAHRAAVALAGRRLSYLSADANARLLFAAQPPRHAPAAGVSFGALMLPALPSGLPTHWLSRESTQSLRRWCEEEEVPLAALRCVVGRVVAGDSYFVVHAEMVLPHRWVVM